MSKKLIYGHVLSFHLLLPVLDASSEDFYSCGTIKVNSVGLSQQVPSPKRLAGGESKSIQHGNLVAPVWQDKKQVRSTLSIVLHGFLSI